MQSNIVQGDYRFYITKKIIFIEYKITNKFLLIERKPFSLSHTTPDILSRIEIMHSFKAFAILGIITIKDCKYLLFVKNSLLVGVFNTHDINRVQEVDILPITEDNLQNEETISIIQNIKKLLNTGFYYSFSYDLSNSFQKQVKSKSVFDKNYLWNYNICHEFFINNIDLCFYSLLIYGYVGIMNYTFCDNKKVFTTLLISRRNWLNPYMSDIAKGINHEGNVANYIETEQILLYDECIHSYIHLRGNAPILYESLDQQLTISKNKEQLKPLFTKHIQDIHREFNLIFFINLLNSKDLSDQTIKINLQTQFEGNNEFSVFCKNTEIDIDGLSTYDEVVLKFDEFINSIDKIIDKFDFFCCDLNKGEIFTLQKGVFRIICIDSLGKTNFFQTLVSIRIFEKFMKSLTFKLNTKPIFNDKIFEMNFRFCQNHKIIHILRKMWQINGAELQNQYKENLETTNIDNLFDNLNLNLEKMLKKDSIDYLLQKSKISQSNSINHNELLIYLGTWNVAGLCFGENLDLFDWLFPTNNTRIPDLYFIGFQEIVDLIPKNIMLTSSNTERVEYWKRIVSKNLSKIGNYVLLQEKNLVGICLMMFAKESVKNIVQNLNGVIVKTGFIGMLGNKGNVIIRFDINNVSYAVSCCHMTSDLPKNESRIKELSDILTKSVQINPYKDPYKELKFINHDILFVFGDLNFRIELENSKCRQIIKSGRLEDLRIYDQFFICKNKNPLFMDLEEGDLTFDPTYKYDFNSNEYDTSVKKRVPAWCDRILWKKNKAIQLIDYNVVNYLHSDHRPVFGVYSISFGENKIGKLNNTISKTEKNNSSNTLRVSNLVENRTSSSKSNVFTSDISLIDLNTNDIKGNIKNENLIDLNTDSCISRAGNLSHKIDDLIINEYMIANDKQIKRKGTDEIFEFFK